MRFLFWFDCIVPLAVEGVTLDVDGGQFGFGDSYAAWIARAIDVTGNGESFAGRGGSDQLDDDLMADERLAAPVLGDVGEQSVLDAVPFAGAGRQMNDRHGEARLVGEALQLTFPQMNADAVAAAAIGRDQQTRRMGIAGLAEPLPPATDALDGECRRVGVDADIDPTLVGGDVVDPIGRDLAQSLDFEVVDADRLWLALAAQLSTAVFEVAHQFLFLRVDRDRRLAGGECGLHPGIDVLELRIAVGMLRAFAGLAVGLTAIVQLAQQRANQLLAHHEALLAQRSGDVALAAADPAQRRLRIAADRVLDQLFERRPQPRLTVDRALAATAAPPDPLAQLIAASLQLGNAAIDRAARDSRRRRNRRHPATAQRQRLVGRKQSTSPLVQKTGDPAIACPKRFDINHRHKISKASVGCINIPILFLRSFPHSDSIVSHRVLRMLRTPPSPPANAGAR